MHWQNVLRTSTACLAAALAVAAGSLLLAAPGLHAQDTPATFTGTLALVWGDRVANHQVEASTHSAHLVTADGRAIPLEITPDLLSTGDFPALQGAAVEIDGQMNAAGAIQAQAIRLQAGAAAAGGYARPPISGSHPWLVLLCRGEGAAVVHEDPLPFYDEMMGSEPDAVDHYWRELSYGKANVVGSRSAGWFELPEPASAYQDGPDDNRGLLRDKAAKDCTAAADPTVDFSPYEGIILFVPLQPVTNGGGTWFYGGGASLKLDGRNRYMRVVWMPLEIASLETQDATSISIVLHEMGHGFGLPHSSGPYGATYDSIWDVMSRSGAICYPFAMLEAPYGCPAQHTIAVHKEWLGWIGSTEVLTLAANSAVEVLLNRLALPQRPGVLMIKAPIGDSDRYYTIEARQTRGYDKALDTQAVIVHAVDPARVAAPALVVDPDFNGNPNDDGAQWLPGERFDGEDGFTLCVKGRTPDGFIVAAGRNGPVDCTFTPDLSPSRYRTDALYPSAGQTVTLQIELVNYQAAAATVAVTVTLPGTTSYISGTAKTSQGAVVVAGSNQLVFFVGEVGYAEPVWLSYAAVVKKNVVKPTAITHSAAVVWEQGATTLQLVTIANPLRLMLPVVRQ